MEEVPKSKEETFICDVIGKPSRSTKLHRKICATCFSGSGYKEA